MVRINWKTLLWGSWLLVSVASLEILSPLAIDCYILLSEIISMKHQIVTPEKLNQNIAQLRYETENIESQIQETLVKIPSIQKLSAVYESLGNSAVHHRVSLSKISPQPIHSEGDFRYLEIEATIHSDFHNFVWFLYEIESKKKLFRVHTLEIKESRQRTYDLQGQLQLSTYLR